VVDVLNDFDSFGWADTHNATMIKPISMFNRNINEDLTD
jgi:hypothetical protein